MDYISRKCKILIKIKFLKFHFYLIKDCDIRLWHVENCDTIKQVMEQNKLKNAKIVSVSLEYVRFFFVFKNILF
jgi:hypothetical protein